MSTDAPIPTGVKVAIAAVLTMLFAPFLVFFALVALGAVTGGGLALAMRHTALESRRHSVENAAWALSRAVREAEVVVPCSSEEEARATLGTEASPPQCLYDLGVRDAWGRIRLWVEVTDGTWVVRAIADFDDDGQPMEVAVRDGGPPELVRED